MKQRIITLFLAIGCITMGIVAFFICTAQDHTVPEIEIKEKSIIYTEGGNYDVLLEGVSAKDNIDGDLSSEVFVSKIVPLENEKAIVFYAVTDEANNVGIAKRTVDYVTGKKEEIEAEDENKTEETTIADKTEEDAEKEDEEKQEEDSEEELKPDGKNPAIALSKEKMTIKLGESFDKLSVVKNAVDDKDDRTTLYQHIHADGNINTNKKGSYTITYYVTDSDGNASEKKTFTLTVK